MSTSKDLLLAILSMDSYNRGYNPGIEGLGESGFIGSARILSRPNEVDYQEWNDAGFYAVSYTLDASVGEGADVLSAGSTVISYRGTDSQFSFNPWSDDAGGDVWNGYGSALGSSNTNQAHLAAEFFQAVTGTSDVDPRAGDATLVGHSLGGGLAGFIGAIYNQDAVLFNNMAFEGAAFGLDVNAANDNGIILQRVAA